MENKETLPAAVIMVKHPEPGKVKTRLTPLISPPDAAELYIAFIKDTAFACQMVNELVWSYACTPASSMAYFEKFSIFQAPAIGVEGPNIGRCIHIALRMLEDGGHPMFAAIASDCPTICSWHIRLGFQRLQKSDVVIGPSNDGGYYFIGLKKTNSELFSSDLPWSTPEILSATLRRASRMNLTVDFIPPLPDVDTPEDLVRLRRLLSMLSWDYARFTRVRMECLYKWYPELDKFSSQGLDEVPD